MFVCPILSGSGVRVKLLEAFAAGIPVVSTVVGAEGLACQDGEFCRLADDPAGFAERVLAVFEDSEKAAEMAARARAEVERNWDMAAITRAAGRELSRPGEKQEKPTVTPVGRTPGPRRDPPVRLSPRYSSARGRSRRGRRLAVQGDRPTAPTYSNELALDAAGPAAANQGQHLLLRDMIEVAVDGVLQARSRGGELHGLLAVHAAEQPVNQAARERVAAADAIHNPDSYLRLR